MVDGCRVDGKKVFLYYDTNSLLQFILTIPTVVRKSASVGYITDAGGFLR
jgi:hypothetical protein